MAGEVVDFSDEIVSSNIAGSQGLDKSLALSFLVPAAHSIAKPGGYIVRWQEEEIGTLQQQSFPISITHKG